VKDPNDLQPSQGNAKETICTPLAICPRKHQGSDQGAVQIKVKLFQRRTSCRFAATSVLGHV